MCGLMGIETITMLPGHRGASLSSVCHGQSAPVALIVTLNVIRSGVEFLSLTGDENKVDNLYEDNGF